MNVFPQKVLVLGLGLSGLAASRFLSSKGAKVIGMDRKEHLENLSDMALFPDDQIDVVRDCGLVVISPGVPPNHPICKEARQRGIEVIGEMELGARFVVQPAIGITGTNGKTTTVSLVAHVLNAKALGNIGSPLTEYLLTGSEKETLVIELSSYQLETLKTPIFDAGALLNITPDHLERHGDIYTYAKAKANLLKIVKETGEMFVHQDVIESFPDLFSKDCISYGKDSFPESCMPIVEAFPNGWKGISLDELIVAFSLCRSFGISVDAFFLALKSFQKPPHRLEFVRSAGDVSYINDSKATNLDATLYALKQMQSPVILIAGGRHKGGSFERWKEPFKEKVKKLLLFGEAKEEMGKQFQDSIACRSLDEAVLEASKLAGPGDTVLFSPGCSSFDLYSDFAHRGEKFKKYVWEL